MFGILSYFGFVVSLKRGGGDETRYFL